jgi:ABC-type taurine transport system ATPase subunit
VVFEGLNLEVHEDEFLCVLGPSGCGKTTLLRLIDGLLSSDGGEVRVDGERVTGPRPDVTMVFQHFGLFPWKRLEQNVAYGLKLRGAPRHEIQDAVRRYINLVGLEGFERKFPYQLSGGMQQRAGLARALALKPEVLLLDNPLTGLDPRDVCWWLELLDKLSAGHPILDGRALTLVVTGDDLRPWRTRARQFAVLKDKSFIVLGNRPELAGHPEPMLQELLPAAAPGA